MTTLRELCEMLASLKGPTLITTHSLADIDSASSALALAEYLAPRASVEVRFVDEPSASARRLLTRLGFKVLLLEHLNYENVVIIDVSSVELLGNWAGAVNAFQGTLIAIDHHYHRRLLRPRRGCIYVNRKASSCAEIIWRALRLLGASMSERQATLLLCGILADTALFKSANEATFEAMATLLPKTKRRYRTLLELVEPRLDVSERIARLKALRNLRARRIDDLIVASAEATAFELGCAAALVQIGCDVAFVANAEEGRISGAKHEALPVAHIGKIMERAGIVLLGSGGGHENVGGARGEKERIFEALDACVKEFKQQVAKARGVKPSELREKIII